MKKQKQLTSRNYKYYLTAWKKSGKNKAQYCKETGLDYQCFNYWFRKKSLPVVEANKFLPVYVKEVQNDSAEIFSLVYPNGCVLKIHRQIDVAFMNQLLKLCN
jgi:hypothetical protein